MRRFLAGIIFTTCVIAASSVSVPATPATYETELFANITDSTFRFEQRWALPLSRLADSDDDRLFVRRSVSEQHATGWGATLSVVRPELTARLFVHEDHESSPDPFRLVHGSVRSDSSRAAAVWWHGPLPGYGQFVDTVPLRDGVGPLLFAQAAGPMGFPVRFSLLTYGTNHLRHRFHVLDGDVDYADSRLRWGIAWQQGVELIHSTGLPVSERAGFVRLETAFGRQRAWLLVHDTTRNFRSLAASTYPFQRGTTGIESRWQWRPATNQLLSVYGETSVDRDGTSADKVELSFSSMPRHRWGWRLGVEASRTGGQLTARGWDMTLTNHDRRFTVSASGTVGDDGHRHRFRAEWDEGPWRLRVAVDDRLPGWRTEWRWAGAARWQATVVYKQRTYMGHGVVPWLHVRLSHDISGFGDVWIQWMEPDLGRLDVGWSRPQTVSAGVRAVF